MATTTHHSAFDPAPAPLPDSPAAVRTPALRPKLPERHLSERMRSDRLRSEAVRVVRAWRSADKKAAQKAAQLFANRLENAIDQIAAASRRLKKIPSTRSKPDYDVIGFLDSLRFIRQASREAQQALHKASEFPHVEVGAVAHAVPRSYAVAVRYLRIADYAFDEPTFLTYMSAAQEESPLTMAEVWSLKPYLEFALLERLAELADRAVKQFAPSPLSSPARCCYLMDCADSLQRVLEADWKVLFEEIDETEEILQSDPLGAYPRMDFESREAYRAAVAEMAKRSNCSEHEIARKAVALAVRASRNFSSNQRAHQRKAHVGYYLIAGGQSALKQAIHYRPRWSQRIRTALRAAPDFFYFIGVESITLAAIMVVLAWLNPRPPALLVLALFLLPAAEFAVAIMNLLVTTLIPPERLSKLDFSKGIPKDCATIVAVPSILTTEGLVKKAVRDLEVRFLGNRDPYLNFALLTDSPDSPQQFDDKDELAHLCSQLIDELNRKYRGTHRGSFFHFHRRRAYNPSEGLWMGWERKRGKLLEFNRFLQNQCDPFPVKSGDLSLLSGIRYVITLDLDTQLPPGAAHRLIATLAHPLNAAVIDPATSTVVEGYGILQPRVEISPRSARRSRLASLFSDDTGFDVYTRAVSDVYQDLFGDAIFSGKGIYELETFQRVLAHRFPCNAVLSHDLIEGAHARTGLVSDVEVIDDYPSHFSALSRRKHRWIRGDWQIVTWLWPWVRDSFGRMVRNPLGHVSRWKIVDNLRRSLMDVGVLIALLGGWLFFPEKALPWTLAILGAILIPIYGRIALAVLRGGKNLVDLTFWRNLLADWATANVRAFLRIAFLCHQSLIALDAIIRTIVRMTITHKRMLEWETAADAEASAGGKHLVDTYLRVSFSVSLALAALIFFVRPHALPVSLPFLAVWASLPLIARWLDQPLSRREIKLKPQDQALVRGIALRTWRFFREFSTPQENWLVPDIVQLHPPLTAHRISTTNLGLLLDSRLAAHDLGFLTVPEFVAISENTFHTIAKLPKYKGHLYNWYTTDTLTPVEPLFVSTVDNGNLLCSLWTLAEGCHELVKQPLFRPALWQSIHDHIDLLGELIVQRSADPQLASALQDLKQRAVALAGPGMNCYDAFAALDIDIAIFVAKVSPTSLVEEIRWWALELAQRSAHLVALVSSFAPWLAPSSAELAATLRLNCQSWLDNLSLETAATVYTKMSEELCSSSASSSLSDQARCELNRLGAVLVESTRDAQQLSERLTHLAEAARNLADEMDFQLVYDPKKELLSIGCDIAEGSYSKWHYDLLTSEARAAVFAAVAQGTIPPKIWFRLTRSYGTYKHDRVLLSWTGTMFEYLMPCLWIKTYPNTLLDRGARAAIRAQQKFARERGIPWGISECSCNERSLDGHYVYRPFGLSALSLHHDQYSNDVVVTPYATFLAMLIEPVAAAANVRAMKELGWLADYGFCEAADFTASRVPDGKTHETVRNWMAHHQGMILVAAANVLCDSAMNRRFHADPRVAAAERVLHEKAPRIVPDAEPELNLAQEPASSRLPRNVAEELPDLRHPAPKFT